MAPSRCFVRGVESGPTRVPAQACGAEDGVLGMGPLGGSVLAGKIGAATPLERMVEGLDAPVMGFWLDTSTPHVEAGEIALGGTDDSKFDGNMIWLDFASDADISFWNSSRAGRIAPSRCVVRGGSRRRRGGGNVEIPRASIAARRGDSEGNRADESRQPRWMVSARSRKVERACSER